MDTARAPDPMLPRPWRVERIRKETADVFTLACRPTGDARSAAFEPGSFSMLYVFGVGEVPISISGDPDEPDRLVHTVRAVGAVTRALCALRRGDVLGVRGPFGTPWPVEASERRDVAILAGGLGLAPLRPLVYRLFSRRERYGRITVLYGTRTPADILYAKEIDRWRRRGLEIEVTVDNATSRWTGRVGVVTRLVSEARLDPDRTTAFVCGPEIMMRFSIRELRASGLSDRRIYLSMERNMKCAVGFCGHCQFGPTFVCKDGPVFRADRIERLLHVREI